MAGQLPEGFALPPADADLGVSAVAFEDLDDDGDLDMVVATPDGDTDADIGTADGATGPAGIVVWVNDGSGRLTRKTPAPSNTLGREPASPSLEERDGPVVASVQPDPPVTEALSAHGWLTLTTQPCAITVPVVLRSTSPATLRSRAPPVRS